MIQGQFTIQGGPVFITAALEDWQWRCDDARTLRFLRAAFAPTGEDRSPAAGAPGARLVSRAAEFFGVEPLIFIQPSAPLPDNGVH